MLRILLPLVLTESGRTLEEVDTMYITHVVPWYVNHRDLQTG